MKQAGFGKLGLYMSRRISIRLYLSCGLKATGSNGAPVDRLARFLALSASLQE
jgi:hypothetical protein